MKSPLHLAGGGGEIVGGQRVLDVGGGDVACRHLGWVEPDAHGEGLAAEDVGRSDPVDGLQARLDHPRQIVGDLRQGEHGRVERQVHERGGITGLLDHHRILRFARELVLHLRDLREHVGHRAIGVGVEAQVQRDRGDVLLRVRDQRVDAFGGSHGLGDRRRDETLDHVGIGAGIGRGDRDRGRFELRVLADLQLGEGCEPDEQDQQADNAGQHRTADEEIGEGAAHRPIPSAGRRGRSGGRRDRPPRWPRSAA